MSTKTPITVVHGGGIGAEIMKATLQILEAAGATLDIASTQSLSALNGQAGFSPAQGQ